VTAFLSIRNLVVEYPIPGGKVHAVSDLSLDLARGETLGLVGESGCGKSSAARAVMQLPRPTAGQVVLDGTDLTTLRGAALQRARRRFQMIFQDPIASLNPRLTVSEIVSAPLEIAGEGDRAERDRRVAEMLDHVGLNAEQAMERRPHEFSGGQCQRISIARALILQPDLLVCDEPVSALDVSVQAQILNLLDDLKRRFDLTYLFISHDLSVVESVSDRVAVMYAGRIVEQVPVDALFGDPQHPYTRGLLASVPRLDRKGALVPIAGLPPNLSNLPPGCAFAPRCHKAQAACREGEVALEGAAPRAVRCLYPETDLTGKVAAK